MVVNNSLVVAFPFQNHFTLDHIVTSKIFLFSNIFKPPKTTSNLSYNASFHGSLYKSTSVISKFFKASFSLHYFSTNARIIVLHNFSKLGGKKKIYSSQSSVMPSIASTFSRYFTFIQKTPLRFALRSRTKKEGNDQKHCSSFYSYITQWPSSSTLHFPWGWTCLRS